MQISQLDLGHFEVRQLLAARQFDDANNARRDFGHAHATEVASGEEYLDGLGAGHAGLADVFYFLSTLPIAHAT